MSAIRMPWWAIIIILCFLPITLPILLISNLIIGINFSRWTQKQITYNQYQFNGLTHQQQLAKYQHDIGQSFKHLTIDIEQFNDALIKRTMINNHGIRLNCLFFKAKKPTTDWIIVVHGWTENCYQALNLGWYFRDYGYNVCYYDARGHGNSSKVVTTIGINEKTDLAAVVDYLRCQFQPENLGLIGHSMGGATIIEYLKAYQPPTINFAIVDGVFTTLIQQYQWMVKKKYHLWPWFGIVGMIVCNILLFHFNPNKCQPINNLAKINHIPLLVIHSKNDDFVIYAMGEQLYQAKINSENPQISQFLSLTKAQHTKSTQLHFEIFVNSTINFAKANSHHQQGANNVNK